MSCLRKEQTPDVKLPNQKLMLTLFKNVNRFVIGKLGNKPFKTEKKS